MQAYGARARFPRVVRLAVSRILGGVGFPVHLVTVGYGTVRPWPVHTAGGIEDFLLDCLDELAGRKEPDQTVEEGEDRDQTTDRGLARKR